MEKIKFPANVVCNFAEMKFGFPVAVKDIFVKNPGQFHSVGFVADFNSETKQAITFPVYVSRFYPMRFACFTDKYKFTSEEHVKGMPINWFRFVDILKPNMLKEASKEQITDWIQFNMLNPVIRFENAEYKKIAFEALKFKMKNDKDFEKFTDYFETEIGKLKSIYMDLQNKRQTKTKDESGAKLQDTKN